MERKLLLEQDEAVLRLRAGGANVPEIANALGMTETGVENSLSRQLAKASKRVSLNTLEAMRLELVRYDELTKQLSPFAQAKSLPNPETGEMELHPPNVQIIDRLIKLSDRRLALLGLTGKAVEAIASVAVKSDAEEYKSSLAGSEGEDEAKAEDAQMQHAEAVLAAYKKYGLLPEGVPSLADLLGVSEDGEPLEVEALEEGDDD